MTSPQPLRPRFEFSTANRIIFGCGAIKELGPAAAGFGRHAMLVCGVPNAVADSIRQLLQSAGLTVSAWPVEDEPTLDQILDAVRHGREQGCDVIIGLGGGSAMDTAKAVSALAANPGDPMRYLEVIGEGLPLEHHALPCVAAPTTAGTGAEVTRNAVIGVPDRKIKVSLRSPFLLPKVALIDPALTRTATPAITAATGMDALTQVLEPFVCARANSLTDGFCRDGLRLAARSLRNAYTDGENLAAREEMSLTSLYGGLALANAGLGAVHGFAAPLGGILKAPHGALCARLLPGVMAANVHALRKRDPHSNALARYGETAQLLTGQEDASPEAGIEWVRMLMEDLHIPQLAAWGLAEPDLAPLAEKAAAASSMKANPIVLTSEELREILAEAI
jgi:alcohol dehydrogenase class IV